MALDFLLPTLAQLGTAVFAASGALAGLRNRLDIVGVTFVATLTGIGGGTVRDLLLGETPIGWVTSPVEIIICIVVALGVSLANQALLGRRLMALLVADAAGLALFAVLGADRALAAGAHPFIAILLGAMTAHVHSPAGGRGMNIGIADAAWLAWSINAGREDDYEAARLPVARKVIADTRRLTNLVARTGTLRNLIVRHLMPVLLRLPGAEKRIVSRLLAHDMPHPPWIDG